MNEGIPTPDTTEANYEISGFWRRVLAFLADGIALGIFGAGLGLIWGDNFAHLGGWGRVIGFAIALPYFGLMNSSLCNGQTLGKRLARIKVIASDGRPLSIGRSFLRFGILGVPYFLNGAPISPEVMTTWLGSVLSVLVFGAGISIVYLYVFNRRTRQSLHDLIVGSYVVTSTSNGAAPIKSELWRGHCAVAAIIILAALVAPFIATQFAKNEPFSQLLSLQNSLMSETEVKYASVMAGKSTFTSSDKGTQTQHNVTANVTLSRKVADYDPLADKLARIILDNYPESQKQDAIVITISYGYDIGIASVWQNKNFAHSPSQWRERLGKTSAH